MKHSASASRRADARAGFSLIEMLAALAIAGALIAVVSEFAGRTLRNWNRGEQTIAVMEMVTRGLGRLSTDLSLALPMSPPGTDGSNVFFSGEPRQLQFVAATGFGAGNRGVELLDIAMIDDHGDTLVVRRRGLVTNPPTQFRDPVILFRGRMQIRFFYRDRDGQLFNTWTKKSELPAAVVVEILNVAGDKVFATPFIISFKSNLTVDCLDISGEAQQRPPRCTTPVRAPENNPAQKNPP